jgi:hypothetical protein
MTYPLFAMTLKQYCDELDFYEDFISLPRSLSTTQFLAPKRAGAGVGVHAVQVLSIVFRICRACHRALWYNKRLMDGFRQNYAL